MRMNGLLRLMFFILFCCAGGCVGGLTAIDADIAIVNGQVVDGSGAPRYFADIAVTNDRITFIGSDRKINAGQTIDAKGLIVAPGFIDGHSHTGEYIVDSENRLNESMLSQGVTTIVFGADGMFAPAVLKTMLDRFQKQGIGTNVGFYVGHNGIRKQVMGKSQRREPTKEELLRMQTLVREGMELGAVGFSTGLMYEPGMFSETREVIELSKIAAEYGGIYDSHIRDPVRTLLASVQELIDIGFEANIAAKIAHVKAVCLDNAGNTRALIDLVNDARRRGRNIVSDQYPYDGAKTEFLSDILLLPETPSAASNTLLTALLKDAKQRERIRRASENGINGGFSWLKVAGYRCIRITHSQDYPQYVGKYLSEIALAENSGNFDTVAELLINARHEIRVTLGGVAEQDVQDLLVQPWNMIVSDGKYINEHSSPRQHPRSTGTFPRVLGRYVREQQLLTLEQAIAKMSSQPADFLGFSDRGRIEQGKIADMVVFDQREISDRSDWANPLRYARGIRYVLVNGSVAFNNSAAFNHASASPITVSPGTMAPRTMAPRTMGTIVKRNHRTSALSGEGHE